MILLFLIIFNIPTSVFAETIILKSRQKIEGKIIERTDECIKIDFYGVILTYYLDEIDSIEQNTNAREALTNSKKRLYYKNIDEVSILPENEIDLTTAILLVYKEWDNEIDIDNYRKQINEIANNISGKIKTANLKNPAEIVGQINEYLSRDLSLRVKKMLTLDQTQKEHESLGKTTLFTYLLDKREGQCVSFSYLYLVIAERLNLPIYLVAIPYHFFVRYDDGITRFNIETLQEGTSLEDQYYIKWKNISSDLIIKGIYLRNLNKKEAIGCALLDLNHLYAEKNETDKSIEIINKSLEFFPDNVEAYQALGGAYLQKYADLVVQNNQYEPSILELSIEYLEKALNINPNYSDALINLGTAQMMKGEYEVAVQKFKKVLEVKPDYGPAYQRLSALYLILKQYELAWEYANKAADLGWPIQHESYEEIKRNLKKY